MATSSAPYWGNLEGPKIDRSNYTRAQRNGNGHDENEASSRNSSRRASHQAAASQPRQNRASMNSQAPTVSDNSPFASPTASSFRGDGLAPRPTSFQYGSNDPYAREYEKRRRRASKEPENLYSESDNYVPPSAPDPPRPGPPASYRKPQTNSAAVASIQNSTRSN